MAKIYTAPQRNKQPCASWKLPCSRMWTSTAQACPLNLYRLVHCPETHYCAQASFQLAHRQCTNLGSLVHPSCTTCTAFAHLSFTTCTSCASLMHNLHNILCIPHAQLAQHLVHPFCTTCTTLVHPSCTDLFNVLFTGPAHACTFPPQYSILLHMYQ